MRVTYFLFLFSILSSNSTAFAYNQSRCFAFEEKFIIPYTSFFKLLSTIVADLASTSSYSSSTGSCSATAMTHKQKLEHFYAYNKDNIDYDLAVGNGEYLDALAYLEQQKDK